MTAIQRTDVLAGLRPLEAGDLPRYKTALAEAGQLGFAYYFPGLLAKQRPGSSEILIAEDNGSLCLYRWTLKDERARLDILFAPLPFDPLVMRRSIERVNEFNGDRSARILKIDERDSELIAATTAFRVKPRRSQYLYDPESFQSIAGRKYRTIRRNVNRVEALADVSVLPYTTDHYDVCFGLLKRWRKHHREAHGTQGGYGTTRRLLNLAAVLDAPDLFGEVIFIEGELAAFGFGGEIRPGLGAYLEAKSDPGINGLSYFQRYTFLRKQTQFKLINDGSDTGREGLRQLKQSLRPVAMHQEYIGRQVQD